jgi:hypothetical protein
MNRVHPVAPAEELRGFDQVRDCLDVVFAWRIPALCPVAEVTTFRRGWKPGRMTYGTFARGVRDDTLEALWTFRVLFEELPVSSGLLVSVFVHLVK